MNPPRNEELARRVAATLQSPEVDQLAAVLAEEAREAADYEASVRGGGGGLRAGRMMVERASVEVVSAIASALGVAIPPASRQWLDLAQQERVPIIAGWDVRDGDGPPCAKLYVNASDVSEGVRSRLCAALVPGCAESPAVLGMNAYADGTIETKLYLQSADAVGLAGRLGDRAQALAAAARAEGADAGGVLSLNASNVLQPRAFFVALREPAAAEGWACVRSLAAYDAGAIAFLLPFVPAAPRSVGVSLSDDTWTLYFKPLGSGRAPETLEPAVVFRGGDVEVGVFVEPTEHAVRAFRRTERHAVSVRVRAGAPTPKAIESLVDWFTGRLRVAENGRAGISTLIGNPPEPWCVVEVSDPFRDGRGEA